MKIKVTHNEKDWRPDEADIGLEEDSSTDLYIWQNKDDPTIYLQLTTEEEGVIFLGNAEDFVKLIKSAIENKTKQV